MQMRTHVFDRVVCGADGSDAGIAATRLAARVVAPNGSLVVVGNRGLRGIRALGSVGERIAHEALSPVLVVREARA